MPVPPLPTWASDSWLTVWPRSAKAPCNSCMAKAIFGFFSSDRRVTFDPALHGLTFPLATKAANSHSVTLFIIDSPC